jgi:hypothetical protein
MQGQPNTEATTIDNVVIKNNTVIRLTDPNLAFPGYLQGISEFDGNWENVVVSDNVVVTDAWHGIAFYGAHHLLISKNIVLRDSGKVLPCVNVADCSGASIVFDTTTVPAINIRTSKLSVSSSDVTIEDNLVSGLSVDPRTTPVRIGGNICISKKGTCPIGIPVDGKMLWVGKPGIYAGNAITSTEAEDLFAVYDPANMRYDLRLKVDPQSLLRD